MSAGDTEMMQGWMDHSQAQEARSKQTEEMRQLTLTKLSSKEDIKAYLMTFEE